MEYTEILNILNKIVKQILFEEKTHTYYINSIVYPSTSKILKQFYKPFDTNLSKYVAIKRNITQAEVLKEWEEKRDKAAKRGTNIHLFGEEVLNKTIDTLNVNDPFFAEKSAIIAYINDIPSHWKLIGTEAQVFSKKYKYASTIDILWYNTLTKKVIVDDYKTNESLNKWYNNYLLEPFDHIRETNYNKYTLQLNHYGLSLEEYGIPVEKRRIIHIEPNEYTIYEVDNLSKELKEYYEITRVDTESPEFIF